MNRRAVIELVLAAVAALGCVLSWQAASETARVDPILEGEPATTSVVYYPPLIVLALILATAAGVLVVLGIARIRLQNGGSSGSHTRGGGDQSAGSSSGSIGSLT
ncbi:hypothetical protein [Mycolicibacterium sp. J2]|uniref:hypothetical protein n=1 Tax=Mycolicibacterium sp. J2 TaxID=2993511 RepID=UPI00224A920C|nr:hypothetical protein [Mycolicibacterium sp. J2]MCX2710554.1 hypothetical protein [Mycolicibacterium sp. J2]